MEAAKLTAIKERVKDIIAVFSEFIGI